MHSPSVLVFAPHFDDETLACGGVLHRLSQSAVQTSVCGLTWSEKAYVGDPDIGERIKKTQREARSALQILGVSRVIYPDEFWQDDVDPSVRSDMHLSSRGSLLESMIRVLRGVRPDVVITTHPADFHTDHRAAAEAAREAVYQAPRRGICGSMRTWPEPILLFGTVEVESLTPIHFNVAARLSAEDVERKCQALSAYEGFVDEHPDTARSLSSKFPGRDWIYTTARLRGMAAKAEFAEPFELANIAPQIGFEDLLNDVRTQGVIA
jgi:LmbE family N-acetylglucosaminyl deacetylase